MAQWHNARQRWMNPDHLFVHSIPFHPIQSTPTNHTLPFFPFVIWLLFANASTLSVCPRETTCAPSTIPSLVQQQPPGTRTSRPRASPTSPDSTSRFLRSAHASASSHSLPRLATISPTSIPIHVLIRTPNVPSTAALAGALPRRSQRDTTPKDSPSLISTGPKSPPLLLLQHPPRIPTTLLRLHRAQQHHPQESGDHKPFTSQSRPHPSSAWWAAPNR